MKKTENNLNFETATELATIINERHYTDEITDAECEKAKELGLIIVFGASDDLCEFRGAYFEELGAYNGNIFHWDGEDFTSDYEAGLLFIQQDWAEDENKNVFWGFNTNIPNAEHFKIMEDGLVYGQGLVFEKSALTTGTWQGQLDHVKSFISKHDSPEATDALVALEKSTELVNARVSHLKQMIDY